MASINFVDLKTNIISCVQTIFVISWESHQATSAFSVQFFYIQIFSSSVLLPWAPFGQIIGGCILMPILSSSNRLVGHAGPVAMDRGCGGLHRDPGPQHHLHLPPTGIRLLQAL